MNKKKKLIIFGTIIGIIILLFLIAGGSYYYLFTRNYNLPETSYIYIDRDDTIDSLYQEMEKRDLHSNLKGFRILVNHSNYDQRLKTGRFAIYPDDNNIKFFKRLSRGQQTPVNITFNNIRTREQLAKRLSAQLMIDSTEIAEKLFDPEFQKATGYNDENIISMFIPNTYQVYWNISTDNLLKRMQKEHEKFWTEERLNKAKVLGLTPEQVATLASIVEEETNNGAEKPIVAGLYLNRLKIGMPLQADPTVKFATGDFSLKRIYNEHLKLDSPYNTYKYAGLPPGPIRIPSIQGLESVLNHQKHNYLYMCAKEDFSGTHNFASTLREHMINARKYQNALNKRNIF